MIWPTMPSGGGNGEGEGRVSLPDEQNEIKKLQQANERSGEHLVKSFLLSEQTIFKSVPEP